MINRSESNDVTTVGLSLDGFEVRIAGDGEILVRGELVAEQLSVFYPRIVHRRTIAAYIAVRIDNSIVPSGYTG